MPRASSAVMAAESTQPVPCVWGPPMPRRFEPANLAEGDDTVGGAVLVVEMATFDHDDIRAQQRRARGLRFPCPPRVTSSPPTNRAASGRFGVTTVATGNSSRAQGRHRVVGQQRVAVLGDEDRVDHEPTNPDAADRGRDRRHQLGGGEHAGLRRVDPNVRRDRVDLPADQVRAQRLEGMDAEGILPR